MPLHARSRLLSAKPLPRSCPFASAALGLALALLPAGMGAACAADDIVVAAVATNPGPQQPDGGDVTGAVEAALAEISRKSGLLGRPLRLITYAEDCSPASAEAIAGKIVARGAALVVGHLCSAAAIAAAPVYARHGIMMITPGARAPRLTEPRAGPGVFRLAGRDDRFGAETATLIATRFAARRVAIVNDLSVQARTLADAVDRELRARSVTPVLRATYIAGEREYNAVVDKLVAAEADIIVVPAQPVEARIIVDGLRARHVAAILIGSEILAVPEMEAAARRLGDALIVMLPGGPLGSGPDDGIAPGANDRRVTPAAFQTTSAVSRRSRAAIEAWAYAVARAGSLDVAAIARVLETESAPTAAGRIRFDVRGDAVLPSFTPHTWRDERPGGVHPLERSGNWRQLPPQP